MSTRNHKATFERWTEPADQFGEAQGEWQEVCREWVSLNPVSGRELANAQQVESLRTHTCFTNYSATLAAVTSDCRMVIGDRIFHIESVINVREQNRELQLMVVEKP